MVCKDGEYTECCIWRRIAHIQMGRSPGAIANVPQNHLPDLRLARDVKRSDEEQLNCCSGLCRARL